LGDGETLVDWIRASHLGPITKPGGKPGYRGKGRSSLGCGKEGKQGGSKLVTLAVHCEFELELCAGCSSTERKPDNSNRFEMQVEESLGRFAKSQIKVQVPIGMAAGGNCTIPLDETETGMLIVPFPPASTVYVTSKVTGTAVAARIGSTGSNKVNIAVSFLKDNVCLQRLATD
jgi:hypothetical protein